MTTPTTALTGTRAQQIAQVSSLIQSRIAAQYGPATASQDATSWQAYAAATANANVPVDQLYLAWFLNQSNLPASLGQDIATAIGAAGSAAAAIPNSLPSISPLSGLASIGDFFGRLSEPATWIRVGEVVLGLVLLAVGLARLTNAVPAATKIATAVGAAGLAA